MAHKKAGGSTRNGRDSNPKYLGVKRYGGESVLVVRSRIEYTEDGKPQLVAVQGDPYA